MFYDAALVCRYGQLLSSEPLRVNFHPSSLLSIGDLLAFVRDLSAATAGTVSTALPESQPVLQPGEHAQLTDDQLLQLSSLSSQNGGVTGHGMQPGQQAHVQEPMHVAVAVPMRALTCAEAPPSIEEQMALADGLTSRIPQRCVPCAGHIVC